MGHNKCHNKPTTRMSQHFAQQIHNTDQKIARKPAWMLVLRHNTLRNKPATQ